MPGHHDAFISLKAKLDGLPEGVVVIGAHTQGDSRKEKVDYICILFLHFDPNICFFVSVFIFIFQSFVIPVASWRFPLHQTWEQPDSIA